MTTSYTGETYPGQVDKLIELFDRRGLELNTYEMQPHAIALLENHRLASRRGNKVCLLPLGQELVYLKRTAASQTMGF